MRKPTLTVSTLMVLFGLFTVPTESAAARGKRLAVGDSAPNFSALDYRGETVSLGSFAGNKVVVLYFYPKDDTPGCTTEAIGFRDKLAQFAAAGAEVIGVSDDSADFHKAFAKKYKLPFRLLTDTNGALRERYGVRNAFLFFPGRVTFVIDKQGKVAYIYDSMRDAQGHVDKTLAVVQQLAKQGK